MVKSCFNWMICVVYVPHFCLDYIIFCATIILHTGVDLISSFVHVCDLTDKAIVGTFTWDQISFFSFYCDSMFACAVSDKREH